MNSRYGYIALLVAMGVAWGATQPLGKMAVATGHGAYGLIFWQLVVGALVLGAVSLLGRKPFPLNWRTLRFAVVIALIGTIIPNTAFYYSVARLPAGVMSILISTIPLIAFPMALALGMDHFSVPRLLGLLCGVTGVALIALPQGSLPEAGMVAFLPIAMIGPLFYAMESNYVGRFGMAGMDAVQAMFLASAVGAVIALPLAIGAGQFIDPLQVWGRAEWALVASSVIHCFAYASYVWLAAKTGAVFASQTSYIVTGTGVVWAMLLLGERFSPWVWAAMTVMLIGLFLVQPRSSSVGNV